MKNTTNNKTIQQNFVWGLIRSLTTDAPNYTKEQLPMLKRHIRAIETILRAHFSGEIKLEKENIEQLHEKLSELTDHEIALSIQN